MRHRMALIAGIMWVVLVGIATAYAQDFVRDPAVITDDEVNAIASKMFCTECENIPLDVCGTQACIQWREEIRLQLAEGKTEQDILAYFRINHGERALAIPGDPVLRSLSTVTPYIIAALGLLAAIMFLMGWQKQATAATTRTNNNEPPSDDPYLAKLEQDLRQ